MKQVKEVIISDEIFSEHFVCDLGKCKGACCVEGDLGAPLEEEELEIMEEIYQYVEPYMTEPGKEAVKVLGKYVSDFEGDYSTPLLNGKECVYAFHDFNGALKCAVEQANIDGKTNFKKPLSCHLYPIRILKLSIGEAINYDRWDICADACTLGDKLKVPVYKFLKEPLIRRYGVDWYAAVEKQAEEL